jgi:CMP-2-keto-3-deoxyoctulosonic acid synthetase
MPPLPKQGSSRAIFIPARLESTRLARKMLLPIPQSDGSTKPLICITAENALHIQSDKYNYADVYVLTDSEEIGFAIVSQYTDSDSVSRIPFRTLSTAPAPNGTARSFDAIRQLAKQGISYEHIAILQGDVPNIDPSVIPLVWSNSRRVTTLVTDLALNLELENRHIVKSICGRQVCYQDIKPDVGAYDQCYYFTRSPVPYAMKHIGIYGLNSSSLMRDIADNRISFSDNSYIAEQENLEQLNWISKGYTISASYIRREQAGTAIDTQVDYDNYCNQVTKQ